ncbi:MAG: cobalamin-dependent protein [Anaerolineales bacterium]|nr:cobalamin-dependent protein [Anaerolineales bacterium]
MDKPKNNRLIEDFLELEERSVLELVQERLSAGDSPLGIINDAQTAMRLVGERYEQGKYYISSMMMASEIFREIMEILEPLMSLENEGETAGRVLICTVQGDIHDIGKNLLGVLLRLHGFTVIDLGQDTAPETIVQEVEKIKPDLVALSGLITLSYESMKRTVQLIREMEDQTLAQTPVIIGGGTINEMVSSFVGADYWSIDAIYAVQLCRQILEERK